MPRRPKNLTGQRFGHWVALSRTEPSATGHTSWLCRCDCGTEKIVRQENLTNGRSQSCGCAALEQPRNWAHPGDGRWKPRNRDVTRTPPYQRAYHSWYNARRRTTNPQDPGWANYGARGIRICDRWGDRETGFENFLSDMGEPPPGTTLDRINNDLDYGPDNCRWATPRTQARNRRGVKLTPKKLREMLALHESGTTTAEIAKKLDLSYKTTTLAIWIADTLSQLDD